MFPSCREEMPQISLFQSRYNATTVLGIDDPKVEVHNLFLWRIFFLKDSQQILMVFSVFI